MKKFILALLLFCIPLCSALAAEDYYHFASSTEQKRFETLTSQLRCLVCQNQNLTESNAGLANDLRQQIFQKIQAGQPNQAIIDYLVARYGDFILYSPPLNTTTWILWFAPLTILLAGMTYLLNYLRTKRE